MTRDEVEAVLAHWTASPLGLCAPVRLRAPVLEALQLRVKDLDFGGGKNTSSAYANNTKPI